MSLLALILACKPQTPPHPAPAITELPVVAEDVATEDAPDAPVDGEEPTLEEEPDAPRALIQALSVRDPEPACSSLTATAPQLEAVVGTVSMPPWVPMRAATCLVREHASEVETTLVAWLQTPETRGLARIVLNNLDAAEPEIALRLAQTALEGPFAEEARPPLSGSTHPAIRSLVEPP